MVCWGTFAKPVRTLTFFQEKIGINVAITSDAVLPVSAAWQALLGLIKYRLQRIQRSHHPRQILLRDVVADHNRPAADRVLRHRAAATRG